MSVDANILKKVTVFLMMNGYDGYENEPLGGGNPYYCCSSCGISDPAINGHLFNHSNYCEHLQDTLKKIIVPSLIEDVYEHFSEFSFFFDDENHQNVLIRYLLTTLNIPEEITVKQVRKTAKLLTYTDLVLAVAYLYYQNESPKTKHEDLLSKASQWKGEYIKNYLIDDLNKTF
jgi:glutamine amidotransferase-like uncharacterized protein